MSCLSGCLAHQY